MSPSCLTPLPPSTSFIPPPTSFIPPPTSFAGFLVAHERKSTSIFCSNLTEWYPGNWDAQDYLTHHYQLSQGGNETDTNLFEDSVSKQPITTSAKEDEVRQCPICYGLGPVYTYCRDCKYGSMIYQPKPHSNPTTMKTSSYESKGEDEVGQCPICNGLGPAYTYCVDCENSGMIYQPKYSSSVSEGSDSEIHPPFAWGMHRMHLLRPHRPDLHSLQFLGVFKLTRQTLKPSTSLSPIPPT